MCNRFPENIHIDNLLILSFPKSIRLINEYLTKSHKTNTHRC